MIALRCGSFWTASASASLISRRFLCQCPCCRANVPETEFHLLFACQAWQEERVRSNLVSIIAPILRRGFGRDEDGAVALLLGGAAGDVLADRVCSGVQFYKGKGDSIPRAVRLATFLSLIRPMRVSAIWRHSTRRQGPDQG